LNLDPWGGDGTVREEKGEGESGYQAFTLLALGGQEFPEKSRRRSGDEKGSKRKKKDGKKGLETRRRPSLTRRRRISSKKKKGVPDEMGRTA